jgi:hypothetical protein
MLLGTELSVKGKSLRSRKAIPRKCPQKNIRITEEASIELPIVTVGNKWCATLAFLLLLLFYFVSPLPKSMMGS